eukprot:scaffold51754_cov23-Tisochrysis_lutea.AAC.1
MQLAAGKAACTISMVLIISRDSTQERHCFKGHSQGCMQMQPAAGKAACTISTVLIISRTSTQERHCCLMPHLVLLVPPLTCFRCCTPHSCTISTGSCPRSHLNLAAPTHMFERTATRYSHVPKCGARALHQLQLAVRKGHQLSKGDFCYPPRWWCLAGAGVCTCVPPGRVLLLLLGGSLCAQRKG